jgi:hypothetical protein
MSRETKVQRKKSPAGFIDEILNMAAMAAVFVIAGGALCEYVMKPLWHIIKLKM